MALDNDQSFFKTDGTSSILPDIASISSEKKVVSNKYYFYKGHIYAICDELEMKHPVSREWVKCVRYRRADVDRSVNDKCWVRESAEFYDRFVPVDLEMPVYLF